MWQHLGFSVAKVAKSVESLLFQVKCPWPESLRASGINRESGKPYNRIDFIHITACRGVLAWDWYHHRFCILFQNNFKTFVFFFVAQSLSDISVKHEADVSAPLSMNVWQSSGADHRWLRRYQSWQANTNARTRIHTRQTPRTHTVFISSGLCRVSGLKK